MTDVGPQVPAPETVGGFDHAGRLWVLGLFALGGAVLGALVPLLAGWAADLPWVPFRGPLKLLGSFDQSWLVWGRPVIGVAAGLAFAVWVILDSPVLDVDREEIAVRRRGEVERVIPRDQVASIYLRGRNLVIETDSGRTLFEDEIEGDKGLVRDAFLSQGFPWDGPRS